MGILVSSIFAFIPSACSYIFKKRSHLTKVYLSNLGLIKGLLGVIDYIENSRRIDDEFHSYDEMITKSQKDLLELLLENSNIFIPHKLEKISEVLLSNYVEITEIIMEIRKCRDKYESQLYSLEECNGSIDLYKNELVSNYKSELLNYKNRVLKYEKKYDKVITSNF
jgi:DNA repair ATPase RecN